MSMTTSKLHERNAVLAVLPPASSGSNRTTGWFLGDQHDRVRATIYVGASSAAGTFRVQRATTAAGSGAENASATIAFGGTTTTGNDVIHVLDFEPRKYATAAKPYLAIRLDEGGTYLSTVVVEGYDGRYRPGDNLDAVSVAAEPALA